MRKNNKISFKVLRKVILLSSLFVMPQIHQAKSRKPTSISKYSSYGYKTAQYLYSEMKLHEMGLSINAFIKAHSGWVSLNNQRKLLNPHILCIADLSQSSKEKRLFILDINSKEVLYKTFVAHGRNSGEEYATKFSNSPNSFQSSPGFYVTGSVYNGKHGESLRLKGVEKGKNNLAEARGIVVHGADYVSENFIKNTGRLGRSQGCPAIPQELTKEIIPLIKGGACFYIHKS